jgi:hypothetical protein
MSEGAAFDVEVSADSDMDELAREIATLTRQHELTVMPAVPAATGASLVVALSAVSIPQSRSFERRPRPGGKPPPAV